MSDNHCSTSALLPHSSWNAAYPINHFPNEFFVEIARIVRDQSRWMTWLRLCGVCRHWRSTILSTPMLWSDIQLTKRHTLELLQRCLHHSKSVKISIRLFGNDVPVLEMLQAIAPHAGRIVSLDLDLRDPDTLEDILSTLNFQLPILRSLTLDQCADEYGPVFDFSQHQFPSLRNVSVRHIQIPWPASAFHSLTSLYLEYPYVPPESSRMPLVQFLEMVNTCPELRSLTVSDAIQSLRLLPDDIVRYPQHNLKVSLPKLKDITLWNDYAIDAAYLLAHLSPSPHARIEISINLASDAQDNEDYKSLETFTAALPRQWPMMPIFSAAQTLTLLFLDTKVKLRATTDGGPSLTICQDYEWADFLDVVGNIPLAVDEFSRMFSGCPVRSLDIYGLSGDGPMGDEVVGVWHGVLARLPTLKDLCVEHIYAMKPIFKAMGPPHLFRSDRDGVVCPHLQSITVEAECFGDDPTFEAVLSMLEYRAARGSRLQKLRLTSQSDDLAKSTIQAKFAHLVDDFDYDCVERPEGNPKLRKFLFPHFT